MLKRFLVIFSLSALLVTPVLASEGGSSPGGQLREKLINKVDTSICTLKSKRDHESSNEIDQIAKRLTSVKERTAKVKLTGKDVSGVETLIATAESAIADARSAISGLRTFTCPTLDKTAARPAAQASLDTLKTQLKTVVAALQTARKAVSDAALALVTVLGKGVVHHE